MLTERWGMVTLVYGRSDDLIEIDGSISEELYAEYGEPTRIRFNDGTVLAVEYGGEGTWVIDTVEVADKTTVEILPIGAIESLCDYSAVAVVQRHWEPGLESVEKVDGGE